MSRERRSDCPISTALEIFGDRWTLLVVRDLLFKDKRSYGEFLTAEERIATNVLADRLSTLQKHGLVTKTPSPADARRVEYALTPKGRDLAPMLVEMILWSAQHDRGTAADPAFVTRAHRDRAGLLSGLMASA